MKKTVKFLTGRAFVTSFLILIQIILILYIVIVLARYYIYFYAFFALLSLIIVVIIINKNSNPMFKLAWIIPILIFPIFGGLFYLLFGSPQLHSKNRGKLSEALLGSRGLIKLNNCTMNELNEIDANIAKQAKYLSYCSQASVFRNTLTEFLSPGDIFFEKLIRELKKAKKFIFLEYFIISKGKMWNDILRILIEKSHQGVEVRVIYDDFGTINTLPNKYYEELKKHGIKAINFNPFKPSLDVFMNYRDHRKLAIIDGKVGFTGGVNLADEYINEKERFGYWQDASIMLKGDAVNKLTIMFLQLWYFSTGDLHNYDNYICNYKREHDGYVIPFSDEPLDQEFVCEKAYINVINNAKNYVYICTPYLILDDEVSSALSIAAKSGVEVVVITPRIADKKIIHLMTRSNYLPLIQNGVKIYEYLPGFMHAKTIVSDDEIAIIGTSNFDYRSFYLHFENGVWLFRSKAVIHAKRAHIAAMKKSELITEEFIRKIPKIKRVASAVLKILAPLM